MIRIPFAQSSRLRGESSMPANAALALEAHLNDWRKNRFPSGEPKDLNIFEYYCLDQLLRAYSIGDGQIKAGMIGGGGDGGIDGLYMFVNDEMVDTETELAPKEVESVKIVIVQVKSREGFKPIVVEKLYWFADDLFDLSKKKANYHTTYNQNLILLMRLIKDKLGVIIGEAPPMTVEFYYSIKLDVVQDVDCDKQVRNVKKKVAEHFPNAECKFSFVNADELWKFTQARPPRKRSLKWESQPLSTQEGIIGLVRLPDYYKFLKEENGGLAERIFDSNVRGYWRTTDVNRQIATTLKNENAEFWLLNNGITILAEKVGDGQKFLEVEITDPQIVNGLQTSRQIFNYYREDVNIPVPDNRRVLVRIIKTADTTLRDDVIRYTNSQNQMPAEALRTTDPIHRKIEQLFRSYNLYYDRRKGHYREKEAAVEQIVSVVDVLQAMLAVVLRRPDDARARPRNYVKSDDLYASVFGKEKDGENDKYSLALYLKSTEIVRRIENYLDGKGLQLNHRRNLNFYLCTYATCIVTQNAVPYQGQILKIDIASLDDALLDDCFSRLYAMYNKLAQEYSKDRDVNYDSLAKGPNLLKGMNAELKRRLNPKKERSAK